MPNFADRFLEAVREKKSPLIVGIDPQLDSLPQDILDRKIVRYGDDPEAAADAIREFEFGIIDAVADVAAAVKINQGFHKRYGVHGLQVVHDSIRHARSRGLLSILDAKENDIGHSSAAYADGSVGSAKVRGAKFPAFDADAITVNPYPGFDGVDPFLKYCPDGKGVILLVKTSNPGSADIQDRIVLLTEEETDRIQAAMEGLELEADVAGKFSVKGQAPLYSVVGMKVSNWGKDFVGESGVSSVGGVVGATYPGEAKILRRLMSNTFELVPGYGAAQGGKGSDMPNFFLEGGKGAGVNSSRDVIFAFNKPTDYQVTRFGNVYGASQYRDAARAAALYATEDIVSNLRRAGKWIE